MWLWRQTIFPGNCGFRLLNDNALAQLVEDSGCFFKLWQVSYEMRRRVGRSGARLRVVAAFVEGRDPWQGHLWVTKVVTQFKVLLRYGFVFESVRVAAHAAEICGNDFRCLCDEQAHALELQLMKAHVQHCPPFKVHARGGAAKECVLCLTVQPKRERFFFGSDYADFPIPKMATLAVSDGTATVVESEEPWVDPDRSESESDSDESDRSSQAGG